MVAAGPGEAKTAGCTWNAKRLAPRENVVRVSRAGTCAGRKATEEPALAVESL